MFKRNRKSLFGFTLTELLIALTIIGAIAALTIPSLMQNLQNKLLITQLKSNITAIQQLANDQLIYYRTKDLQDTDFAQPTKLLSKKNFPIVKQCSTATGCWSATYKILSNMSVTDRVTSENISSGKTVILANGSILTYTQGENLTTDYPEIANSDGDKVIGMFRIDVNGNEKPNIVGRDVFWFLITKKGKIVDYYKATNSTYNEATAISNCKTADVITACASVIMINNWTSPY